MDIDFDALKEPLDAEGGAGPDLADDPAFAQFEADVEGFFPSRADDFYYGFRTANAEIDGFGERCLALLARSRDLRLMVALAKIAALSGNIAQAGGAVGLIRHALETGWDTVHPTGNGSGHVLRGVTVERLDEFASFVLPLQYAALVSDRNGHLSYRDQAVASGAVIARDEDSHPDAGEIARFLERCDLDALAGARDLAAGLADDIKTIGLVWTANAEDPPSLAFKRLTPMVDKMAAFLEEAVAKRDPSRAHGAAAPDGAALPDSGEAEASATAPAGAAPTGTIASLADARAALHAASRYFELCEPSSPAFLLARKAENLVGLTFPQVLQQIAPDRVYDTAIQLGPNRRLPLPMEKLTEEFSYIEVERDENASTEKTFEANDRASAMTLLQEVARWYRAAEPSNPIPLLLDKARELTSKDFAALLSEITVPTEE
ncbi:MAG: hypothetical protein AcusKO_49740 [Acuticoccus sp.]